MVWFCLLKENNWAGETTKNAASAYSPDVLSLMLKIYGGKTREQKDKIEHENTRDPQKQTTAKHHAAGYGSQQLQSEAVTAKVTFSHGHRFTFLPYLPHSMFPSLPHLHQFDLPWFTLHS